MNLWQRFTSWLGSFFAKPAPVQAPVQAAPTPAPVAPSATVTITIPGTDRKIDPVTAAYLGVSAETSKILDDRVKNAPPPGDGWIPGSELGNGQNFRANWYDAGVPFVYQIHASGPFEFKWSESAPIEHNGQLVATPPGTATVVVSGPAGNFPGSSNLRLGAIQVPAKAGEVYTATLVASMSGPGHAQI